MKAAIADQGHVQRAREHNSHWLAWLAGPVGLDVAVTQALTGGHE